MKATFDKRVYFDLLLFLHSVANVNEITTWKRWLKTLRKKSVHNTRAREKNERCCKSSNKRILTVNALSERERWLWVRKNNTWNSNVFNNRDSDSWWFEIWRKLIISFFDRWEHFISSSMRLSQIVKDIRKVLRARYHRSDNSETSQRRRYACWQYATMRIRNNSAMNLESFKMRQQLRLSDKSTSSSRSQIHDHRFQY